MSRVATIVGFALTATLVLAIAWGGWQLWRVRDAIRYAEATRLMVAAAQGDDAGIRRCLAEGDDVNQVRDGVTALYKASSYGHETTVRLLLESGADPNLTDPLVAAAIKNRTVIASILLDAGAKLEGSDYDPLWHAAIYGQLEMIKLLIDRGAKWRRDEGGLLRLCVVRKHPEILAYFISLGADVNARDEYGRTALHYAARNGELETVQRLIAQGARTDVNDNEHKSPKDLAEASGHCAVAHFLEGN